MKYQKGDIVKIVKPQVYGQAYDTTSEAENDWTEEMNDMVGMEVCLTEHVITTGWQIVHNRMEWGFLEDWLEPVDVKGNSQNAYDRAMSIL